MSFSFSEENRQALEALERRYPSREALMLPALWRAQEQEGYLGGETLRGVAEYLQVPLAQVYGVVTFYSMFHLEPPARYEIQLCKTLSCDLCGKAEILAHLQKRLKIAVGERSEDGRFALKQVECLGSCGTAPVMQINDALYENLTPEKIDEILEELE